MWVAEVCVSGAKLMRMYFIKKYYMHLWSSQNIIFKKLRNILSIYSKVKIVSITLHSLNKQMVYTCTHTYKSIFCIIDSCILVHYSHRHTHQWPMSTGSLHIFSDEKLNLSSLMWFTIKELKVLWSPLCYSTEIKIMSLFWEYIMPINFNKQSALLLFQIMWRKF